MGGFDDGGMKSLIGRTLNKLTNFVQSKCFLTRRKNETVLIYSEFFVRCQKTFSLNLQGAVDLGAYQQNHLVRISNTTYVDFTDIPAKSPRAKCVHLLRVRPSLDEDKNPCGMIALWHTSAYLFLEKKDGGRDRDRTCDPSRVNVAPRLKIKGFFCFWHRINPNKRGYSNPICAKSVPFKPPPLVIGGLGGGGRKPFREFVPTYPVNQPPHGWGLPPASTTSPLCVLRRGG